MRISFRFHLERILHLSDGRAQLAQRLSADMSSNFLPERIVQVPLF